LFIKTRHEDTVVEVNLQTFLVLAIRVRSVVSFMLKLSWWWGKRQYPFDRKLGGPHRRWY